MGKSISGNLEVSKKILSKVYLLLLIFLFGVIVVNFETFKDRYFAKVVNESGRIRGGIQRVAKLYFAGDLKKATILFSEVDNCFKEVDKNVENLKFPILDRDKNLKPIEVEKCWNELKEAILNNNRQKVLQTSERCWFLADRLTYLYQTISERNLLILNGLYTFLSALALILIVLLIKLIKFDISLNLERRANYDNLTGIFNRAAFSKIYNYLSKDEFAYPMGFIVFDLDDFKAVNDRFGHQVGDKVLKTVAEVVKKQLRKTDIFARWGGEEFTLLLPHTDLEGSKKVAEKLRKTIQSLYIPDLNGNTITASFGVTEVRKFEPLEEVFLRADKALYKAKEKGKNRVELNPP